MLVFKQHLGPAKKTCLFVGAALSLSLSLYGVHVVLTHVLCAPVDMETQENPGNQAETTETSREPRKTQETKQKKETSS